MDTSGNIESADNLLDLECYLRLVMDAVGLKEPVIGAGSDEREDAEHIVRLQARLSRPPVD